MKVFIKILFVSLTIAFSIPIKLLAQTPDEKWISLGDCLELLKKDETKEWNQYDSDYKYSYNFYPKSDELSDQIIINKVAYKRHNIKNPQFYPASLFLQKIDGMNGTTPIYGGSVSVSYDLDIRLADGKKIKNKEIPTNEEGWKVYDFNDLMRISSIGTFTSKGVINLNETSRLLNNIYIALADTKQLEGERRNAIMEQAYKDLFVSPNAMGWTPASTEKLSDGTIVDHYSQGVRTYKKTNGDFATFIERDDIRNPKTLDLISGATLPIDSASYPIGAFKITQPNGLILESDGIFTSLNFLDGNRLIVQEDVKDIYYNYMKNYVRSILEQIADANDNTIRFEPVEILKNDSEKSGIKFNKESEKYVFFPFFGITFNDFIDPSDNGIFKRSVSKSPISSSLSSYPFDYVDKDGNKILEGLKFYGYENESVVDPIERKNIYFGEQLVLINPKNFIIIGMNEDGLFMDGVCTRYTVNMRGGSLDKILWNKNTINSIDGKMYNDNHYFVIDDIMFDNGDHYKTKYKENTGETVDDGTILTLPNGTKLENIEDKYRITHPDGSRFIGTLGYTNYNGPHSLNFYNAYINTGYFIYHDGVLTLADGTENHYKNGINLEEAALAEAEREKRANERLKAKYNELVKQYGKTYVDKALTAEVLVGMPIKLLEDLGFVTKYNDNGSFVWYKLFVGVGWRDNIYKSNSQYMVTKYRLLKVNKSTGKIVSIGVVQTAY